MYEGTPIRVFQKKGPRRRRHRSIGVMDLPVHAYARGNSTVICMKNSLLVRFAHRNLFITHAGL